MTLMRSPCVSPDGIALLPGGKRRREHDMRKRTPNYARSRGSEAQKIAI